MPHIIKKRGSKHLQARIHQEAARQLLLQEIADGNTFENACACAGIPRRTFYEWTAKGEQGIEPYAEFYQAVIRAKAEAEAEHVQIIRKAAKEGTWQASAWFLERRNPEHWGRRILEVKGESELTADAQDRELKLIERLFGGKDRPGSTEAAPDADS